MRPPVRFNEAPDLRYTVRFGLGDPDRYLEIRAVTRLGPEKAVVMAMNKLNRLVDKPRVVTVEVAGVEDQFELDPWNDQLDITAGYVI